MDFDDLLVRAVNLLELFPEVRERYQQAFRHILVDEYQDTNHAQYRWLQLLAGGAAATCRSSAMTTSRCTQFRGADISNILDFEDDYPDALVVRLEQNYRSTQTILDAANAVISNNRGRMGKTLFTEIGQPATRSRSASWTTSGPRRASCPARSSAWSTRASRARRSRSSTGPTRSRGCWRTASSSTRSPTR